MCCFPWRAPWTGGPRAALESVEEMCFKVVLVLPLTLGTLNNHILYNISACDIFIVTSILFNVYT